MQYYGDLLRKMTKSNTTEVCEFFVRKCLMNAKSRSTNEGMKRFFLICGVSANDGIKNLLEKNELTFNGYWSHRRYFAKIKSQVPLVVKSYLSCLLLLLSSQKTLIFQKTGLNESDLLAYWCTIFKYDDQDKVYFNDLLKTVSQDTDGILKVFEDLNRICHDNLNGGVETNIPCTNANRDMLICQIEEDVYVLARRLADLPDLYS